VTSLLIEVGLGFGIGFALGLLGGGGSILTVPALVYLVGQSPQAAVTTSLAIVGANSLMGASLHSRRGTLNWRVALVFGGAGMLVAFLAAGLSRLFSPNALLAAFALLMLLVGGLMFSGVRLDANGRSAAWRGWPLTVAAGVGVGLLTGVLGVGGGFLIVPALVMLVGLPMRQAVGTSLLIIAANSLASLLGHLHGQPLDLALLMTFAASGVVGMVVGTGLAYRIPAERLRRGFAVFVVLLAAFLLLDNLPKLLS
jgi:uncharacterized membrane protein YfcA